MEGWKYTEISLSNYPEKRKDMLKLTERLTVPQIFFNTKHIGGADDLDNLNRKGELEALYEIALKAEPVTNELLSKPSYAPTEHEKPKPRGDDQLVRIGQKEITYIEFIKMCKKNLQIVDRKCSYRINRGLGFVGSHMVDLLIENFGFSTRSDAVNAGKHLESNGVFHHITHNLSFDDNDKFYQLQADAHPSVLNRLRKWTDRVDKPSVTVECCRLNLNAIVKKYRDTKGLVDYEKVGKDEDFIHFEEMVCEFQKTNLTLMGTDERLTFCINLYNLLVIHAFAKVGIPSSDLTRFSFFDKVGYEIGGLEYSLNDIENGILRANSLAPYHFRKFFTKSDQRFETQLPKKEPRIHFALNCGAKSCPPVKLYTENAIQEELDIVAMAFLEQEDNFKIVGNVIHISKILSWYQSDFGDDEKQMVEAIKPFLRGDNLANLNALSNGYKVQFNVYDWGNDSMNSKSYKSEALCSIM